MLFLSEFSVVFLLLNTTLLSEVMKESFKEQHLECVINVLEISKEHKDTVEVPGFFLSSK